MKRFMHALLIALVATLLPQTVYADTPTFGMFVIYGGDPVPGTDAFRQELTTLADGGVRCFQLYYGAPLNFWNNLLSDLNTISASYSEDLKVLIDTRYGSIDSNDNTTLDPSERGVFINYVANIVTNATNQDHILGWYIADEPSLDLSGKEHPRGIVPVAELEYMYSTIDSIYSAHSATTKPVYIVDTAGIVDQNFATYKDAFDVLIIDYYTIAGGGTTSIKTWTSAVNKARSDLAGEGKEIQALMYLGDEVYGASEHWLAHAVVRRLINLGVDTIWGYGWRTATNPARSNWTTGKDFQEVFSYEPHDVELLMTAVTCRWYNESALYVSDVPNHSPVAGSRVWYEANPSYTQYISALGGGDLFAGDNSTYHASGVDNGFTASTNWVGNRTNGDGDDDIVIGFAGTNPSYNETLDYGNDKSSVSWNSFDFGGLGEQITAMTTGDFDGDGDDEAVFSVVDGSYSKIYLCHDIHFENAQWNNLYSSNTYHVTALASGDFDGIGRDYLVTAISNSSHTTNKVYIADIGDGESVTATENDSNGSYYVTAMTAGYLTGASDDHEKLAIALTNGSNDNGILIADIKTGEDAMDEGELERYSCYTTHKVTAMAALDRFADDRKHCIYLGVWDTSSNNTKIYETDFFDATVTFDSKYDYNYYHVSAMAAASFTESLEDGGVYKVALSEDDTPVESTVETVNTQNTISLYPNPFNPVTTFEYTLASDSDVKLNIYSVTGQKITTLVDGFNWAGSHTVSFDGSNLSSGMYIYRFETPGMVKSGRMMLVK